MIIDEKTRELIRQAVDAVSKMPRYEMLVDSFIDEEIIGKLEEFDGAIDIASAAIHTIAKSIGEKENEN